jgi:hypothetical protein
MTRVWVRSMPGTFEEQQGSQHDKLSEPKGVERADRGRREDGVGP